MKMLRTVAIALLVTLVVTGMAYSQSWQSLTNTAPFNASTELLLTDGTVMVQVYGKGQWWKLTPDQDGSYLNGTWSQIATMQSSYGPLYYGSAVLADGKVIVEGGEYNFLNTSETNMGSFYDPVANTWTPVNPPTGWSSIGDGQSVVLSNGTYMQANALTTQEALFNESSMTWTSTGTGKADINSEEGWTLLPGIMVLTVDANNTSKPTNSERYNPKTGSWQTAGSTVVQLADPGSHELGPAVLRPDGTVLATGATPHNAIFTLSTHTWAAGPDFKNGLDIADGPACLVPSGNVLVATSPGIFQAGTKFFEWDGTQFNSEPGTKNASQKSSYENRLILLPTGQVMNTDATNDVEIYTPVGNPDPAWAPTIHTFPSTVTHGMSYTINGTQFNGLSQACAYGDDDQQATNYPLVRITNNATGHVFYARTHNHSTMAVATGPKKVSTHFDVPTNIETGPSELVMVANGIASTPVAVTVQ
jgi:hypothetical protein